MPTYEYVCDKCGHEFELSQRMTDQPLAVCPRDHCGRKKWGKGSVRKKVSAGGGLLFKGSGFYITDYRSEGYKTAARQESTSAKPASSDSKPAAAGETKPSPAKSESKSFKSTPKPP